MAVIGTFSSYTSARLAIYASQTAMNVTGNNIGNINTTGYTRQRTDQCSLYSTGQARYQNSYNINIGYGALVDNVSQLRDPYLDIRYRNENASLGYNKSMLEGLTQIGHILDEVGRGEDDFGVIEAQMGDFKNALRDLLEHPGSNTHDDLVRSSASTLCSLLNSAAKELQQVKENQEAKLTESIDDVNNILDNIRDLNEQIREHEIYGDRALELRDARNVQIDKLSAYMKISVTYSKEKIDRSTEVDKLTITLADTKDPNTGKPITLVDGIYATQFETGEEVTDKNGKVVLEKGQAYLPNPDYDKFNSDKTDKTDIRGMRFLDKDGNPTDDESQALVVNNFVEGANDNRYMFQLAALKDKRDHVLVTDVDAHKKNPDEGVSQAVALDDNELYGSLQAIRELLTEEGEFASELDIKLDNNATIKRGIPFYQHMLDSFAQKFSTKMNELNLMSVSGDIYASKGGSFVLANDDTKFVQYEGATLTSAAVKQLEDKLKDKETNYKPADDTPEAAAKAQEEYEADVTKYIGYLDALRTQGKPSEKYNFYDGGVLFSNRGDSDSPLGITAENISVSHSWADGSVRMLNSTQPNVEYIDVQGNVAYMDGTTRRDNLDQFAALLNEDLEYVTRDTVKDAYPTNKAFYTGNFQQMFGKASSTLGADSQTTTALYNNFDLSTLNLDNDRTSVSGVDLNEEATNMMQYSQSFSAACKLLTTIDEMLDTLINRTI